MALYKRATEVNPSTDAAFDTHHHPGGVVPHSGVYRCLGCGREIASNAGTTFPPQNHHQHTTNLGSIVWRLGVYAQGNP
jgi:hypothetical protein